ncbi:hypothetical protein J422_07037 [Methanocaldococcus villosus KIN24-T80]|uniref:Uncharacterized protein n=1 Tax=Methanocaldococcus villosus KIN24-T80 TaxID=1069083 RepID=N6UZY4_9EURY|nr:hypothetical protein [Methanocaldococcus villosus]ENN95588.1 hypothetical protein J422_07037 [Methanocaldococcus villosus KIN24-T80]
MRAKEIWKELLKIAKDYYDEDKKFYSKTKRGVYKIKGFTKDKIIIKKLSGKLDDVLTKKRFINLFDELLYGADVKPISIKSFLKLHPKIEEENNKLYYRGD